jgi:hypothetical protein
MLSGSDSQTPDGQAPGMAQQPADVHDNSLNLAFPSKKHQVDLTTCAKG